MSRGALVALCLVPCLVHAHVVTFDFVTPSGIGTHTDGGLTAVQWVDGPDPNALAELTFYASRTGLPPFAAAPRDTQLNPVPIAVKDPANVLLWDATALAPGCYQPFAIMHDQIEGETFRPSSGMVTVVPTDGGNIPPAIWILNQPTDKLSDAGTFALRLKVDDPDDVGEVTVRWSNGGDAGGTVVAGLPTNDGGGTLSYSFSTRTLPPSEIYYLEAEVKGFDGQLCQTWWPGYLPGNAAPDAGVPIVPDAGTADGGVDPPLTPKGCGCSSGAGPLLFAAGLWLRRQRRSLPLVLLVLTGNGCILRSALTTVEMPKGGLEVRDIAYWHGDDWDEDKHRLDLYAPPGPGPHPVLIFVHGGGWRYGDRQQILSSYVKIGRRLAAQGVLAVVISYRLAPHFKYPAPVRDVARAVGWTLQRIGDFGGDPERVYLMGHSAGAQLAALVACDPQWLAEVGARPSQLKGIIGVSGPYDIEHLGRSTLFGGLPMVIPEFGSEVKVWRDAGPANHLEKVKPPPFLVAWADGDPELIRRDARVFTEELEFHHLQVETFESSFADHFSVIGNFAVAGNDLDQRVLQFIQPVP